MIIIDRLNNGVHWVKCLVALMVLISLGLGLPGYGFAAEDEAILVEDFSLYQGEGRQQLVADIHFNFQLTDYLRESLLNGISLQSEVRFDISWHSDWWWNEREALDKIVLDLKYNALSRKYQLFDKNSGENWNFSNLAAALEQMGAISKYRLPALPAKAFDGDVSVVVQASIEPRVSKSLGIHSRFSSLFDKEKNRLVSQEVMWPLTP